MKEYEDKFLKKYDEQEIKNFKLNKINQALTAELDVQQK